MRSITLVGAFAVAAVLLTACSDVDRGVTTVFDEFATARAAADIAETLDEDPSVVFTSSEYDGVRSRLDLVLRFGGTAAEARDEWETVVDYLLLAIEQSALRVSSINVILFAADSVATIDSGALQTDDVKTVILDWIELIESSPIDVAVSSAGETLTAQFAWMQDYTDEDSLALASTAADAGASWVPAPRYVGDLQALLGGAVIQGDRGYAISWDLAGFFLRPSETVSEDQLTTADRIVSALDPTLPLVKSWELAGQAGLDLRFSPYPSITLWQNDGDAVTAASAIDVHAVALLRELPIDRASTVSIWSSDTPNISLVLGGCPEAFELVAVAPSERGAALLAQAGRAADGVEGFCEFVG